MRMRTLRSSIVGHGAALLVGPAPRSWASAMAWNVPAVTDRARRAGARRSRSSPAALRVKVTARTCAGSTRRSRDCHAMRRVSTRVLPDPAPARIANGAPRLVTASRCVGRDRRGASSTAAPYRSGYDAARRPFAPPVHEPKQGRNSGRPRVVSAASQLGSPRGRSCRPSRPSPQGCPGLGLAGGLRFRSSRGWSRSVRSPHRIRPFRSLRLAPSGSCSRRSRPAPDRRSPASAS